MRKKGILILKAGIACGLLALLFWQIDIPQFATMLRGADPLYLILCLLFSLLMVAVSCWKWWLILRLQQCPIPFLRLYRWYFIGYFYSNFLPSNVGGDVARAWYVRAQSKSGSIGVISVFVERFTGIVVLLLMAAGLPFLLQGPWREPTVWLVSVLALATCLALLLVVVGGQRLSHTTIAHNALALLQRVLGARSPHSPMHRIWMRTAHRLHRLQEQGDALSLAFRNTPSAIIQVLALSLLFYALTIVNLALAYRAFDVWPPFREITAVLPTALLVGMVPVSLGNLGVVEGSYVYYFGMVGMAPELTLMTGLFLRFKMLALGLIGWMVQLGYPVMKTDEPINTTDYGSTNPE